MLKGIKQPSLTTRTTQLPGTELPTVRHSSDLTGNKDTSNAMRNMASASKNPFMGQRAAMTNTKRHNHNQVKTALPSTRTGFEPVKIHEDIDLSVSLRSALILEFTAPSQAPRKTNTTKPKRESVAVHNVIDHGVQNGVKVHSGGKDLGSGTKKEQTKAIKDTVGTPKKAPSRVQKGGSLYSDRTALSKNTGLKRQAIDYTGKVSNAPKRSQV